MNGTQSDFQVRSYTLAACAAYVMEAAGAEEGKRKLDGLSAQTRARLAAAPNASATWAPVAELSEILTVIGDMGGGDEDRTRALLVKCGTFMAQEATNTFLRLLMRMLTPNLFAKKFPDLWRRDCTHGKLVTEVTEQKFACHVLDTQGFLHAPCTITGFITFTLTTMGKSIDKTTIKGWSLQTPNPREALIELTWRA